ncbi:uncharacterized protein YjaZ [Alkalihalobacillus xiaoxiensis]|uniref:Uncharacterized protein YjaZ n=1 Tax=Shouchella xiaoxiensis TaxID=766895 RepID=A0ABS2SNS7_9BACI|nr:DUF2268 domain-containing putative Zn-dependent protease [Shouchella xiaoxiensis]MBM7836885.1 uncharacterized protein YjaZ [Shouchella xiaoxiensis]
MTTSYTLPNTLEQYKHLLTLDNLEERKTFFRYTMMEPFQEMWKTIQVPLQAKQENGYDVIMATEMMGYAKLLDDRQIRDAVKVLEDNDVLKVANQTLETCLATAAQAGLSIQGDQLTFGLFVADLEKLQLQGGYTGFGGIPGFIAVHLFPNDYNLPKLPALIAHEFHHNLRFSYFNWNHGNVTVGDYLVIEGLADSFAKELYGEEQLGPWVTSIEEDDLTYSSEVIGAALDTKGFAEVSSYLFGDEIAKQQGYRPVGLSFGAGYAVGYEMVQSFMQRQKKTIWEATLLSSDEIIRGSGMFSLKKDRL